MTLTSVLETLWCCLLGIPVIGWPFRVLFGTVGDMNISSLFAVMARYRKTNFTKFMRSHREAFVDAGNSKDYVNGVCNYYSVMSDLITVAVGPYWHFTPLEEGKTRLECHDKFHHTMTEYLGAKKEDKILEIGCGYGEIGRQVAKISGAKVTGLTMADEEIRGANERIKSAGLESQCSMVQGNYHDLPFENGTFDTVFGVYTLKYSADLKKALSEAGRVLKSRGKFVSYEILVSDAYDPNNETHKRLVHHISYSTCMPPLWRAEDMREAAAANGLVMKKEVDLCTLPGERQWYNCFLDTFVYHILKSGFIRVLVQAAEALTILPRSFLDFYETCLVHPATDFVEAGRLGIITGAVMMVWEKE